MNICPALELVLWPSTGYKQRSYIRQILKRDVQESRLMVLF